MRYLCYKFIGLEILVILIWLKKWIKYIRINFFFYINTTKRTQDFLNKYVKFIFFYQLKSSFKIFFFVIKTNFLFHFIIGLLIVTTFFLSIWLLLYDISYTLYIYILLLFYWVPILHVRVYMILITLHFNSHTRSQWALLFISTYSIFNHLSHIWYFDYGHLCIYTIYIYTKCTLLWTLIVYINLTLNKKEKKIFDTQVLQWFL